MFKQMHPLCFFAKKYFPIRYRAHLNQGRALIHFSQHLVCLVSEKIITSVLTFFSSNLKWKIAIFTLNPSKKKKHHLYRKLFTLGNRAHQVSAFKAYLKRHTLHMCFWYQNWIDLFVAPWHFHVALLSKHCSHSTKRNICVWPSPICVPTPELININIIIFTFLNHLLNKHCVNTPRSSLNDRTSFSWLFVSYSWWEIITFLKEWYRSTQCIQKNTSVSDVAKSITINFFQVLLATITSYSQLCITARFILVCTKLQVKGNWNKWLSSIGQDNPISTKHKLI